MVVGSPVSGLIRGYGGLSDWLELSMGTGLLGGVGYVVGCHLHGYHVIV